MLGAQEVAADEVRLKSQIKTRTEKQKTSNTNSYGGLSVHTQVQDSNYTYQRGSTYTNWGFGDRSEAFGFGTNPPVSGYGTWIYQDTNSASLPWEGEALAPQGTGIIRHTSLVRMDEWVWNGVTNVWTTKSILDGSTNTYTNYMATTEGSPWPMKDWDYSVTNENGNTERDKYTLTTTVELVTDGPANQSALFCLKSVVTDESDYDPIWRFYYSGWTLVSLAPDSLGRVFKVLDNNTTNPVSVVLAGLSGILTNWSYDHPSAERVPLVIEWKGNGTNHTNWSQGPLFVLKGTTVNFRVITPGFVDVAWPPGLPTWSGGGASGTNAQISVTFNTVSADANGEKVIVTAGSKATNQVVVFDYTVQFKPDEGGAFTGRAEYPTNFGVGEGVNFSVKSDPAGITPNIGWSATGMSTAGDPGDWSEYATNTPTFKAGAFPETITVVGTLLTAPSAGGARTNQFAVVRPVDAFLQDILLIQTNIFAPPNDFLSWLFFDHTNVGHFANSMTCGKTCSYFLKARDVSFHGISVREGTGPERYVFPGSTNQYLTASNNIPLTLANGQIHIIPLNLGAYPDHTPIAWQTPAHHNRYKFGPIEANYWFKDPWGATFPANGPLPVLQMHTAQLIVSTKTTITIEFKLKTTDHYAITNIVSTFDFYSSGRVVITKGGSGPHPVEYSAPFTPGE